MLSMNSGLEEIISIIMQNFIKYTVKTQLISNESSLNFSVQSMLFIYYNNQR